MSYAEAATDEAGAEAASAQVRRNAVVHTFLLLGRANLQEHGAMCRHIHFNLGFGLA